MKRGENGGGGRWNKPKTKSKMIDLNPTISITALPMILEASNVP